MTEARELIFLRSPCEPGSFSQWIHQLLRMRKIGAEHDPYIAFTQIALATEFVRRLAPNDPIQTVLAADIGSDTQCDFSSNPVVVFSSAAELDAYFSDREAFAKQARLRSYAGVVRSTESVIGKRNEERLKATFVIVAALVILVGLRVLIWDLSVKESLLYVAIGMAGCIVYFAFEKMRGRAEGVLIRKFNKAVFYSVFAFIYLFSGLGIINFGIKEFLSTHDGLWGYVVFFAVFGPFVYLIATAYEAHTKRSKDS